MPDAATISINSLGDPSQYKLLGSVPWFRAHKRPRKNPETGQDETITVKDADLDEIAAHMQALEGEGRLFRLTHGHINPAGDEDEQPELLGFAKNARRGVFGPNNVPCVLVDEYGRVDKLPKLRERPYRSAEYYPKSKVITGAAALIRDPQLNLGVVTYRNADQPWHYAETVKMPDAAKPDDDFSPEETSQYERICSYMAKKFPKLFGPEAMGPANAEPPAAVPPAKKPDDNPEQNRNQDNPELYSLRQRVEASERENAKLREERERDKCEQIVGGLAKRFRLDPAREVKALLPLDAKGREAHVAYIKANYAELPGGEPIEVYQGHVEGDHSDSPTKPPAKYEEIMAYVRDNPGVTYAQAESAVNYGRK